jgi:tetratricopeptide (TPR) repeat protein
MMRSSSLCIVGFALVFGVGAGPVRKPRVDEAAMNEAIRATLRSDDEGYASSAAYAHFLAARLAHHEGEHRRSVESLQLALISDPEDAYLITSLAEEYARLGDMDHAERELRRVIERAPNYHPAHLLMSRVLLETKRYTRARVHLKRAMRLRPRDPDAYLVLTQLELELDRRDEAERAVEALAHAVPGEILGYKRLGIALAERGDLLRSERLLRKALAADPGDFELWASLAQALEQAGRLPDAADAYQRAIEREPDNQEALLQAGRLMLKMGVPGEAKAYFDRLLLVSDEPEMAAKVAFSYLSARHLAEAVDVLDAARAHGTPEPRLSFYAGLLHEKLHRYLKAAEAYGELPAASELFQEARLRRATCLSLAGQHGRALELFRKGVAEKPDYLLLYSAYARALERSGSARDAEAMLKRALVERPLPELYEALAGSYQRNGRLADAVDVLLQGLSRRPRDEGLLFSLGAAYERKGDFDKSIEKMRALLEVNPDNADAMNFIGYNLAQRGKDLDEAERLVTRALELKPDTGAFLDSLGWLYFRRGDYQKAVDMLERAAALSPHEPVIAEHLGDAYQRASKREAAADAYRAALEALRTSPDAHEHRELRQSLERKLRSLSTETSGR